MNGLCIKIILGQLGTSDFETRRELLRREKREAFQQLNGDKKSRRSMQMRCPYEPEGTALSNGIVSFSYNLHIARELIFDCTHLSARRQKSKKSDRGCDTRGERSSAFMCIPTPR
jgi:hypothetical protein